MLSYMCVGGIFPCGLMRFMLHNDGLNCNVHYINVQPFVNSFANVFGSGIGGDGLPQALEHVVWLPIHPELIGERNGLDR